MDFYLVEQILRHMQIVPAQDEEASGRGVAQQGIEPTEVVELLRERLAGHLAPSNFGMLLHFLVEVVRDAESEIGHCRVLRVPTYLSVRTDSMCRQVLLYPADLEAHRVRQAFQGRSIGPPMPEEAQGRRRRNR